MCQQQVVSHEKAFSGIAMAGRHLAGHVPEDRCYCRFVDGDPHRDGIRQLVKDGEAVIGKPLSGVGARPSALVLKSLRQVPSIYLPPKGTLLPIDSCLLMINRLGP